MPRDRFDSPFAKRRGWRGIFPYTLSLSDRWNATLRLLALILSSFEEDRRRTSLMASISKDVQNFPSNRRLHFQQHALKIFRLGHGRQNRVIERLFETAQPPGRSTSVYQGRGNCFG